MKFKVKKVSVVTVCLNTEREIRLTLESVARQSFSCVEHVIIDGGSTDKTLDIIREYPVGYLVSENDSGVYDAMEKGALAATGDIVMFLNAGDTFWDSDTCSHVAKFFDRTNADLVFGNLMPVYLNRGDSHDHGAFSAGSLLDLGYVRNKRFLYDESIHHQATFYRRRLLQRCPFRCSDPAGTGEYNVLLNAVMKQNAVVKHIPLPICRFVLGGISTRNFEAEWRKYVAARDILRDMYCPDREAIKVSSEDEFVDSEMPPKKRRRVKERLRSGLKSTFLWRVFERTTLSLSTRITRRLLLDLDHLAMQHTQEIIRNLESRTDQLLQQQQVVLGGLRENLGESSEWAELLGQRTEELVEGQGFLRSAWEDSTNSLRRLESEFGELDKRMEAVTESLLADNKEHLHSVLAQIDASQAIPLEKISSLEMKFDSLQAIQVEIQDQQVPKLEQLERRVALTNQLLQEYRRQITSVRKNIGDLTLSSRDYSVEKFSDHGFQVYSQWNEDGLIQFLVSQLGIDRHTFIEIGVGNYTEANTRYLLEKSNWSGVLIEANPTAIKQIQASEVYWRYDLQAVELFVNRENVNETLSACGISGEVGLLSIDVDGIDYWLWEAVEQANPQIVICEYNGIFGANEAVTVPYKETFDRTQEHYSWLYAGASFKALHLLAIAKGYTLIGTNSGGNNAFFVRDDLVNDALRAAAEPIYRRPRFREARREDGSLSFLDIADGLGLIGNLEVFDVERDTLRKVSELKIEFE